jgi:hypothetical protein
VLVASNTVPFVIIASTATATRTPSITPTSSVTPTEAATLTPTTDPAACVISPPPGWVLYAIQFGDSVAGLAFSRGVAPEFVMEVNCLTDDELSINERIYLPPLPATPTVSPAPPTPPPTSDSTTPPATEATNTPGPPPPPPPPTVTEEPGDPPTATPPDTPTEPPPP